VFSGATTSSLYFPKLFQLCSSHTWANVCRVTTYLAGIPSERAMAMNKFALLKHIPWPRRRVTEAGASQYPPYPRLYLIFLSIHDHNRRDLS
jgi:hypothetical protein